MFYDIMVKCLVFFLGGKGTVDTTQVVIVVVTLVVKSIHFIYKCELKGLTVGVLCLLLHLNI